MEHIKSSLFDKRKVYGEDEMKNFPWILKLWDKEISIFWWKLLVEYHGDWIYFTSMLK